MNALNKINRCVGFETIELRKQDTLKNCSICKSRHG